MQDAVKDEIRDGKTKSLLSKVEDYFAVGLIVVLSLATLVIKILQDNLRVQVKDADSIIVNLAFVFASIAGIITWRENRHLSLASVTEKLPVGVKKVIGNIVSAIVPMILVQMFLSSFCELINPGQFTNTVCGLPVKFLFVFYPLCFVLILILVASKKENRIACITGIVLGVVSSMASVTGILYYVAGKTDADLKVLYALFNLWNTLCSHCSVVMIIALIVLAFAGVPLFVVITGISYIVFSKAGGYVSVIPLEAYAKLSDKSIAAIPLFTIAGYVLAQGSAGRRFVNLFNALFGWVRGGTVVATVIVMTFFSTFTGVSGVTILALGLLLVQILAGSGYDKDKAESLVTSSGAIGLLFPPSVAIIMYATSNYTVITQFEPGFDVVNLFVAALVPGIILALSMIVLGIIYDHNTTRPKFSLKAILVAFKDCILELLLPVLICVTYFSGFFNLIQVASFAVIYSIILVTVLRKDFNIKEACNVVAESVPVSGGLLFIIGAAAGLSYFMLDANIPEVVTEFITTYITNKFLFLFLMNIVLLIVGCLMDIYSAILIISPLLLYSAVQGFGIPVAQAGIIFLMNLSIGFLTPPVGMDLFISHYTFKKPMGKVIKGILPFLAVQLCVLFLVTYVPVFTTGLLTAQGKTNTEQVSQDEDYDYQLDEMDFSEMSQEELDALLNN